MSGTSKRSRIPVPVPRGRVAQPDIGLASAGNWVGGKVALPKPRWNADNVGGIGSSARGGRGTRQPMTRVSSMLRESVRLESEESTARRKIDPPTDCSKETGK